MTRKGRIQVGADADITIFDADTIIDTATFEGGLSFSEGIHYVLVNGVPVVDSGKT
jgi:imidazolonepropionase-like amidohydrolase